MVVRRPSANLSTRTGKPPARAAFLFAALLVLAATGAPRGEVLFSGLDDSAQSILARAVRAGAPLKDRDTAFADVPRNVRASLLYRPAAPRKTRDLSRQIELRDLGTKPFFQPFLPVQRAFLPRLPLALAVAVLAVLASGPGRGAAVRAAGRGAAAVNGALLLAGCAAAAALTPWHSPHYLSGPFAEGPATLFAAFALALAFSPGGGAARGGLEGAALGLAVAFHPTLSAFAVPIAAFSVMRSGRGRHLAGLAAGTAAGLAPLVWSTLCVTAPYGNFLSPGTLRGMAGRSRDIAALATALAVAFPVCAAFAALALVPRVRRFFGRGPVRTATAAFAAAAVAAAAAVCLSAAPSAKGFSLSAKALGWSAPPLAAALALAFAKRRGAACVLLALCAWAALPLFAIQGQEVHVGLWSLRRSLPPVVLFSVAAAGAALEPAAPGDAPRRAAAFAALGRLVVVFAFVCAAASALLSPARRAFAPPRGDAALRDAVAARLDSIAARGGRDPIALFDSFRLGAPFASERDRRAFCLSDSVSRRANPRRVARWLAAEARRGRPVSVVASRAFAAPLCEKGFSLVPEEGPVRGVLVRTEGKGWHAAVRTETPVEAQFLRVVPDGGAKTPRRFELDFGSYDAFPFGLRGGWAHPAKGKPGRWATDGAAFCAPIPPPGGTVEIELDAAWTPPREGAAGKDGEEAVQTLRLVPPFPAGGPVEATLKPGRRPSKLRFSVRRPDGDSAARGESGVWTIQAGKTFDAAGFPPRLAALVFRLESAVR